MPLCGHVVDPVRGSLDQADDPVGEVPGVSRRADLVANHQNLAMIGGQAEHRLDEVRPVDPEQPGGADHEAAVAGRRGRLLAGQLGAAVGGDGGGLIGLHVGRVLAAVEDVVAGDVDDLGIDRGGGRRDASGGGPIHRHRRRLHLLGAIDICPGSAVDDDVRALQFDPPRYCIPIGDVELATAEAGYIVSGVRGGEGDVVSEHPGLPYDDHLHGRSAVCRDCLLIRPRSRNCRRPASAASSAAPSAHG